MKKRRDILKSMGAGLTVGSLLKIETNEGTSLDEFFSKYTGRFILNPRDYLNPKATEDIDIREFGEEFNHQLDPMNGMYDTVKDVEKTVRSKQGDCVDYSAVAASWILLNKNVNPKLLIYVPKKAGYGHMNVTDGEFVYNNGQVIRYNQSVSSMIPDYKLVYERKI